uniref:Uncharacterized protein n=1 Tax=Setaria viridis TaxID=4556 RepID=A0A4U6U8F3_SETVI|nr:hypothetical protein SEVIR_6G233450v2 [Setaria viridis]
MPPRDAISRRQRAREPAEEPRRRRPGGSATRRGTADSSGSPTCHAAGPAPQRRRRGCRKISTASRASSLSWRGGVAEHTIRVADGVGPRSARTSKASW